MKKDHYRGPDALKSEYPLRSLDQKIEMYERRLNGWFLNIAKSLRSDPSRLEGGPGADPVCLMIGMSLFESLGVYLQGNATPRKSNGEPESKANFEYGFSDFLSSKHPEWSKADRDAIAEMVYKQVRCGLFHIGTAKKGVWYFRGPDEEHPTPSIDLRHYKGKITKVIFNVPVFILEVDDYYKQYMISLRDKKDNRRKKFAEGWKIVKDNLETTR